MSGSLVIMRGSALDKNELMMRLSYSCNCVHVNIPRFNILLFCTLVASHLFSLEQKRAIRLRLSGPIELFVSNYRNESPFIHTRFQCFYCVFFVNESCEALKSCDTSMQQSCRTSYFTSLVRRSVGPL